LITGPISDRAPLNWLLAIGISSLTASIFVLTIADTPWLGQLYAVFMGIAAGLIGIVGGTLWAKYYGRKHLGKIRGSVFTAGVAGSSVGPFIMGLIYDNLGSYQLSLWIFIGLLIPVVISAFWATPPKRK
jgi:MFS family permease